MKMVELPSQAKLRELFDYCPGCGTLTRKIRTSNRIQVGGAAGCKNQDGYLQVNVDNRIYKVHRLIWVWWYGQFEVGQEIDHIKRRL